MLVTGMATDEIACVGRNTVVVFSELVSVSVSIMVEFQL